MFKQIQNYIKLLIVCLIISNICFTQIEGCTDSEAYNCVNDVIEEIQPNYIFDIGGTPYDNSCNWDCADSDCETFIYVGGCEYSPDNLPGGFARPDDCQGYYLDATDGCRYYQAPHGDEVVFTFEETGIFVNWDAFTTPTNAILESYHVQRCLENCTWLPNFTLQNSNTETSVFDEFDYEIGVEIKYAIAVKYFNNPYWGWAIGASYITPPPPCPAAIGNINGDDDGNGNDTFNVLDIVMLANCVLAGSCFDLPFACAADINGDGIYNVLDIVQLANCVLAQNCSGRIDDATKSRLIMIDNMISIEADGFIGGVQMALQHDTDFSIIMTDRALFADYLTSGNETRLLVITPETDELFRYSGDFEITEVIVANTMNEVPVKLPEGNAVSNILDSSNIGIITEYILSPAFPNPFNPKTMITLAVPVSGHIFVHVYNLSGQVVAILADGHMDLNTNNTLSWDATNAVSGMYFVKVQADGFTATQKLMLLK